MCVCVCVCWNGWGCSAIGCFWYIQSKSQSLWLQRSRASAKTESLSTYPVLSLLVSKQGRTQRTLWIVRLLLYENEYCVRCHAVGFIWSLCWIAVIFFFLWCCKECNIIEMLWQTDVKLIGSVLIWSKDTWFCVNKYVRVCTLAWGDRFLSAVCIFFFFEV